MQTPGKDTPPEKAWEDHELSSEMSSEASLEKGLFYSNAQYSTKVRRHTKKQGNQSHSKEQNKSLKTHPKETQAWNLHDKEFKTPVLNMLKETMNKTHIWNH